MSWTFSKSNSSAAAALGDTIQFSVGTTSKFTVGASSSFLIGPQITAGVTTTTAINLGSSLTWTYLKQYAYTEYNNAVSNVMATQVGGTQWQAKGGTGSNFQSLANKAWGATVATTLGSLALVTGMAGVGINHPYVTTASAIGVEPQFSSDNRGAWIAEMVTVAAALMVLQYVITRKITTALAVEPVSWLKLNNDGITATVQNTDKVDPTAPPKIPFVKLQLQSHISLTKVKGVLTPSPGPAPIPFASLGAQAKNAQGQAIFNQFKADPTTIELCFENGKADDRTGSPRITLNEATNQAGVWIESGTSDAADGSISLTKGLTAITRKNGTVKVVANNKNFLHIDQQLAMLSINDSYFTLQDDRAVIGVGNSSMLLTSTALSFGSIVLNGAQIKIGDSILIKESGLSGSAIDAQTQLKEAATTQTITSMLAQAKAAWLLEAQAGIQQAVMDELTRQREQAQLDQEQISDNEES